MAESDLFGENVMESEPHRGSGSVKGLKYGQNENNDLHLCARLERENGLFLEGSVIKG